MNYQTAIDALNGREKRKLENNTYIEKRDGGAVAVRLHATDVLTFTPSGDCIYNSGGWKTVTTKDRLNKYGPLAVIQKNGQWFIGNCIYSDGIKVNAAGHVVNGLKSTAKKERATAALKKNLSRYAKEYIEALKAGKIKAPSNGDCWGCLMVTKDGKAPMGGQGHILQHIKEKYYVPSLIVRAVDKFPHSQALRWGIQNAFQGKSGDPFTVLDHEGRRLVYRHLRREVGLV